MSATPDSTLANPEQRIADLGRQLAECKAELAEALEQQTAASEVLGVINSSPGDLAPVFDAILEKATHLCEASFGILWSFTGDLAIAGALHRVPDAYAELCRHPFRPSPGSGPARMMRGESGFAFTDLAEYPPYMAGDALTRAIVDLAGAHSLVIEPLRKDAKTFGAITLYRQEVRPFTDKQIALLQNFAAQAVIAMENARLLTQTREALEQQTATAEVLQVINSSPGDLAPVFDAMLEKGIRLCEAAFGSLWTYDGECFHAVAVRNVPSALAEWVRQPHLAGPNTPLGRVARTKKLVSITDLAADEMYLSGDQVTAAPVELGGARTYLAVPLLQDDALAGAFAVSRREVRPFSDKQIELLENFAAQAVIAIENARLLTETREALEQQTATAEVLGVINSSPGNLTPIFDAMLEKAVRLCGAAYGNLLRYDGQLFSQAAAVHPDSQLAERVLSMKPFPPTAGGPLEQIVNGEEVNAVDNIEESAAYRFRAEFREMVDRSGFRSCLNVALRKEGTLLGVITVFRKEAGTFSDKQVAVLRSFAAQAVIAIENARLLGELRQRTGDLEEALEQQTATSEVLGVINSSPGELAPVFNAMLEKAARLCEASHGLLATYDGDRFHGVAAIGFPMEIADGLSRLGHPPPDTVLGRLERTKATVQMADISAEPSFAEVFVVNPLLRGVRTSLAVPMLKEGALVGAFGIFRQEVRPFTEKQTALLQNFAAQAVIAMENARLLTETREALEQQTATAEVLGVINSSPADLAPVFDAMLDRALRLCEAEIGTLWIGDGDQSRAVANRGAPPAYLEFLEKGPHRRPTTAAGIVHIDDIRQTEFYRSGLPLVRVGADVGGVRTMLAVPLRKDGAELGRFSIYRTNVRLFSNKQIALLENFAAQAVIAIENARLITETHEALEQQTATTEVLQVINSSPGDLPPVFDAMLEKAMRLCEADYGHVLTFDGQLFHPGAIRGEAEFVEWRRRLGSIRPDSGAYASPLGRVMRGEHVAQVIDATKEKAYRTHPVYKELVDISGIRSQAAVALRKEDVLFGAIVVYRREVRAYTEKQIALLQNFGAQAVIAMENARLLGELHQRTEEVAELNRGLEARVAEQVEELGRVGRLKRFLAPQLAELIVSQGDEKILESHRREIVVVFCDLRGYTAFTETAEPEEVLDFLREYHGALGPLVSQFEGTLDQFSGDGIMVFFNDPLPCPDPAERAVKMAMAMREAAGKLIASWRRHGSELGFGVGIAQGYATLGQIGFSDRSGYTAIGTVCNLASRLCAGAKDGQIVVSSRIAEAVEAVVKLEDLGNLELKGLRRPVAAFNVVQSATPAEARPNLTIVARGPGV